MLHIYKLEWSTYCGFQDVMTLKVMTSAEIFETGVWKSAEQIPLRVLQWFSQFACSIVQQNQPLFTLLLYYWQIITIKLYSISFISGMLQQQPRAPLDGVSAHFLNMYCINLKEMRGQEIFDLPGWTSQQLLHQFSSDLVVQQKLRCFGTIFEISSGHRKSRIYPNQIFFS